MVSAEEAGVPTGGDDEEDGGEAGATSDEEDLGLDDGSISGQLAHFLRTSGFDDKVAPYVRAFSGDGWVIQTQRQDTRRYV